jgi:hypothetical protein
MSVDTTSDRARWQWLADTFWCVMTPDLPALRFAPDSLQLGWLVDQTVWHIQGFQDGYFWGVSATLVYPAGSAAPRHGPRARRQTATLLGTITPEGTLQISFLRDSSTNDVVVAPGRVREHDGAASLEMQMSTGNRRRVLHWAYMAPVKPGDPAWDHLPGVDMSVPEFLGDAAAPKPPQ